MPLPELYVAERGGAVSRASSGAPATTTRSSNVTVMLTAAPALYGPSAVGEDTDRTVGVVVSITMFLLEPSEPSADGAGSARAASLPARSAIEAPAGRARADVVV